MLLFRKIGLIGGVLAVVVGAVLLPAAPAFAQSAPPVRAPLNLMTSPLPLNVVTKPGQPVTADLRVKNNGTQTEQLKVELLKFGASGDTGRPQLMERGPADTYFDWVSFSQTNFTAEPNVWKTIKMTINPPKSAAFGYYYAVLFSRANPDKPTGGKSAVEGGVASLVLLNVDTPGARREAKVKQISASQKVYEFLPAKFTIKLHNGGNVHVSPVGTIFIKRGNEQVAALDFNQEHGNILPNTDRVFTVDWNDGFPAYKETVKGTKTDRKLEWDFSKIQKLRFGHYTATLVAVYDNGQRDVPVEAVVSFWVIPWRIIGVLLLVIIFIGGGLWAFFRFIWKNIRRQALTPAVETGPDPSSLAAARKHKKKAKKAGKENNKDDKKEPETTEEEAGDVPAVQEDAGEGRGEAKAAAAEPGRQAVAASAHEEKRGNGHENRHEGRGGGKRRRGGKPGSNNNHHGKPHGNKNKPRGGDRPHGSAEPPRQTANQPANQTSGQRKNKRRKNRRR